MGLLKSAAKIVGTVVLTTTGTASAVLKGVSDAIGVELGSELFGAAKDASFSGIRSMWDSDKAHETIAKVERESTSLEDVPRRSMASTAYRAAQVAKQNGDMEKYEHYMEQYERYK